MAARFHKTTNVSHAILMMSDHNRKLKTNKTNKVLVELYSRLTCSLAGDCRLGDGTGDALLSTTELTMNRERRPAV